MIQNVMMGKMAASGAWPTWQLWSEVGQLASPQQSLVVSLLTGKLWPWICSSKCWRLKSSLITEVSTSQTSSYDGREQSRFPSLWCGEKIEIVILCSTESWCWNPGGDKCLMPSPQRCVVISSGRRKRRNVLLSSFLLFWLHGDYTENWEGYQPKVYFVFWPVCALQHYLYGAPFPIVKERKNVLCGVDIYLKRSWTWHENVAPLIN